MKWMLLLVGLLVSFPTLALSKDRVSYMSCDSMKSYRERLQKRMREHTYTIHEREEYNRTLDLLFEEISTRCVNQGGKSLYWSIPPKKSDKKQYYRSKPIPKHKYPENVNLTVFSPQYEGKKQLAWKAFYKEPSVCRLKKPSQQDFIACTEDKTEQKKAFEKQWAKSHPTQVRQQQSIQQQPSSQYSQATKQSQTMVTQRQKSLVSKRDNVQKAPVTANNNLNLIDRVLAEPLYIYFVISLLIVVVLFVIHLFTRKKESIDDTEIEYRNENPTKRIEPKLNSIAQHCPYCLSVIVSVQGNSQCSDPVCDFNHRHN